MKLKRQRIAGNLKGILPPISHPTVILLYFQSNDKEAHYGFTILRNEPIEDLILLNKVVCKILKIIHDFGFSDFKIQQMSHFFFFGFQIMRRRFSCFDLNRNTFDYLQTGFFQSLQFVRII